MAINFPSSPSNGTTHTEAGVTWVYDGTSWKSTGYTASSGALGSLTDVTLSSVQTGQLLSYSGSSWGNASLSLNGLSDVDLATTPPTDGQTLVWDNTAGVWEPGTITGGVGSEVDTLDSVTTRGDTTTNDINVGGVLAGGLKLNVNHTGSPTATVGDIKRINEHPHYYDGTTWRPFYLSGSSLSATTSDVQFEDLQVRLTGFQNGRESDNYLYNYVNGKYWAILGGAQVVSSPVKYGTNAIQFDGGNQGFIRSRSTPDDGLAPFLWSSNADWYSHPGKRGGFPDLSGDWTFETWARFDDLTNFSNPHGIFSIANVHATVAEGKGAGLSLVGSGSGTFRLLWSNGFGVSSGGVNPATIAVSDFAGTWQANTWYHISLSRRASDGRLFCHVNGVYSNPTGTESDTNLSVDVDNSDFDFRIGNNWSLGASWTSVEYKHYMRGYVDDIRWTNFCRYNSTDFSVPTQAYPIDPDVPPTVDPDWNNVKMRLPFDGSMADISSFTDGQYNATNTLGLVTSGQKYGTGALRTNSDNNRLRFTYGLTNYNFGATTFTAEFWINFESLPDYDPNNGGRDCIFANTSYSYSTSDLGFGIWAYSSANTHYKFYWRNAGSATLLHNDLIPGSMLIGSWNHVALVRDSNNDLKVFLNGYLLRYNAAADDFLNDASIPTGTTSDNNFTIGFPADTVNSAETGFDGYIDDFRLTTTVKYTDNFTPPSGTLPTTGTITNNPPGTPTSGYLTYPTTNGTSGQALTSDGTGNVVWSDNPTTLVGLTDTDLTTVAPQTGDFLSYDGTNWIGASTSLTGLADVDLFSVAPTNGQALLYNASTLLWEPGTVSGGGGSSLQSRTTAQGQTSSALSTGGAGDINITAAKTFALLKVETSHAAWVTIYTDATSRTNDSSRTEVQDPAPGSGVLAEVITTGAATQIITPGTFCWNNDSTPSTTTYLKVVNKDPAAQQITVTLTYVQLES